MVSFITVAVIMVSVHSNKVPTKTKGKAGIGKATNVDRVLST